MQQVKRVLLIDDDLIINMVNENFIARSKLTQNVSSYTDGRLALKNLQHLAENDSDQFPEIIFLDMHLPEMDIWEFLDKLSKFPKHVLNRCKVYALSASAFPDEIQKLKTYKLLTSFILKPLTIEKLENLFPCQPHSRQFI